ncbi:MAG: hypothetical protein HY815_30645 [Candidatus Riflebacteria bacterium]|nr:hypothetical protein [Candidatus Riflebacteria bacterium]
MRDVSGTFSLRPVTFPATPFGRRMAAYAAATVFDRLAGRRKVTFDEFERALSPGWGSGPGDGALAGLTERLDPGLASALSVMFRTGRPSRLPSGLIDRYLKSTGGLSLARTIWIVAWLAERGAIDTELSHVVRTLSAWIPSRLRTCALAAADVPGGPRLAAICLRPEHDDARVLAELTEGLFMRGRDADAEKVALACIRSVPAGQPAPHALFRALAFVRGSGPALAEWVTRANVSPQQRRSWPLDKVTDWHAAEHGGLARFRPVRR